MMVNNNSIQNFILSSESLMNIAFQKFYGEPGVPSDLKGLYYVACGLSRLFHELLYWYNSISSTAVNVDFILLRDSFAKYTVNSALRIWDFPSLIMSELKRGQEIIRSGAKSSLQINITLTLDVDSEAKQTFHREIDRLQRELT
jgi:hypothetical protein